jgi:hypothetical protein
MAHLRSEKAKLDQGGMETVTFTEILQSQEVINLDWSPHSCRHSADQVQEMDSEETGSKTYCT